MDGNPVSQDSHLRLLYFTKSGIILKIERLAVLTKGVGKPRIDLKRPELIEWS